MKYYVYELVNTLDGKTFYVGKGRKRRMYIHENRASKPTLQKGENPKLRNKIRFIWKNGGQIVYKQTLFTDDNLEAYTKETDRIKEIGLENLCNLLIHPLTPEECYELRSRQMRGRVLNDEVKHKIRNSLLGHGVSTETRQKMRDRKIGKSLPCSETKRLSIASARRPTLGFPMMVSPDGERHSIDILTDFCKTHNLRLSNVSDLIHGRVKSHKGWVIADNQLLQRNPAYL
jgi:hypothetical protein